MNFHLLLPLWSSIILGACTGGGLEALSKVTPREADILKTINTEVNRKGRPCPRDYCSPAWPLTEELAALEYWDCKAYAVAKSQRLLNEAGFAGERLEYVIFDSPALRVAHASLLVDGSILLDNGTLCWICDLQNLEPPPEIIARLSVTDLETVIRALRMAQSMTIEPSLKTTRQKD